MDVTEEKTKKFNTKKIKKMYDDMAKNYDSIAKDAETIYSKIMYKWILEKVSSKNLKILALGCGTGLAEVPFLDKGYEVTGIDLSEKMIEMARKRPFKKLIVQDIEKSIDTDKNYDVVLLFGVTEFIRNPLKLFKNIHKKLNDDGVFALTIPKKPKSGEETPFWMYNKEGIESIFDKAGFEVIGRKEFFGWHNKKSVVYDKPVDYFGYLLKKNNL